MPGSTSILQGPAPRSGSARREDPPRAAGVIDSSGVEGRIECWSADSVTIRFAQTHQVTVDTVELVRQPDGRAYSLPLRFVELERYRAPMRANGLVCGRGEH
jgi:hypothetical protein